MLTIYIAFSFKAGPFFPRVTLAAEMSLFKPSYCLLPIYHASLPKLEIPAFHSLFLRLAPAAAAKKIV